MSLYHTLNIRTWVWCVCVFSSRSKTLFSYLADEIRNVVNQDHAFFIEKKNTVHTNITLCAPLLRIRCVWFNKCHQYCWVGFIVLLPNRNVRLSFVLRCCFFIAYRKLYEYNTIIHYKIYLNFLWMYSFHIFKYAILLSNAIFCRSTHFF